MVTTGEWVTGTSVDTRGGDGGSNDLWHDRPMDAIWLVAGLALGWAMTLATVWVTERRRKRRETVEDERRLYARALAAYDTAYRLIDLLVNWPRRETPDASRPANQRATMRSAGMINVATLELDTVVRRSRELVAELRLAGRADVVDVALSLHESLEEIMIALKVETPTKLERRWGVIAPSWRSAREALTQAAREALDH